MKNKVKNVFFRLYGFLFRFNFSRNILNFLFENLSTKYRSFIIRNFTKPNYSFLWKVKLLNGKYFKVLVDDDFKSFQFSYNYKWHNLGLSLAEKFIFDYCNLDGVYLDVGANLGLRSIYAASENFKIVLFEPNQKLHSFTNTLFQLNGFKKIQIEPLCLSNEIGTTSFYISSSSYMSSRNQDFSNTDSAGKVVEKLEVELNTLDNYCSENIQKPIAVIKIDAEGEDLNVLKGGIEIIKKDRPYIIVECETPELKKGVIKFISTFNYSIYGISSNIKWQVDITDSEQIDLCSDFLLIPN